MNASERWGAALASWAIPNEILSLAPESPWTFPPELLRSRAKRATTGQHLDLARAQAAPWAHPLIVVVEIDVPADVKDASQMRQAGGMVNPGATVHERHATHPVRMIVENQ